MKKLNLLILALMLLLTACSNTNSTSSDPDQNQAVTNFEECVRAGNLVMESYPRRCQHENQLFVEEVEEGTLPDGQQPCTREFKPVCGEIEIECLTERCDPIRSTFANQCEAENAGATNITEGACVDEEVNPEGACLSFDGNWLPETMECEGMALEQCEALGGAYNECASACRNDPNAEVCTMQCVQVCQFGL